VISLCYLPAVFTAHTWCCSWRYLCVISPLYSLPIPGVVPGDISVLSPRCIHCPYLVLYLAISLGYLPVVFTDHTRCHTWRYLCVISPLYSLPIPDVVTGDISVLSPRCIHCPYPVLYLAISLRYLPAVFTAHTWCCTWRYLCIISPLYLPTILGVVPGDISGLFPCCIYRPYLVSYRCYLKAPGLTPILVVPFHSHQLWIKMLK